MQRTKNKLKALLLFSGGLDSILAAKILEKQGIEVTALTFASYFFDAGQANVSAKKNKIKLIVEDISEKHLKIVKNPCHGRGVGMNPCIDCHLLMLKEAKIIAATDKFDIVATGEVLGQRPMSQNASALRMIERETHLDGRVLRPLCAKALPETEYEKAGFVDRDQLLGISGRSRKIQLALAKKHQIKYFPTPAGGCILTDQEYSKKLRDLLAKSKKIEKSDIELLRVGRHIWLNETKLILGRNHEENLTLKKIAEEGDTIIDPKNIPGPTALLRGSENKKMIEAACGLVRQYVKKSAGKEIDFDSISVE